ncbi:MAG TPA: hypothetical protein VIM27_11210 [Gaiellales bacterium]
MRRLPLLLVLVVALVGASSASAHGGGTASATLTGTPSPVTAGGTVAYRTTFTNGTSRPLQNTQLDAPVPAKFSVLSVVTAGSCTTSAADATCQFGTLAAGATVSATVIMSVPSTTGSVGSSVTWTTSDGDHDDDDLTVQATTTIAVQAPSPNAISEYVLPAGDTVSTGSTTSAANPQSTSVDVPATPTGAATSVSEVNATSPTDACGPGAKCVGQISVVIVAVPPFPATDPLHLSFLLDSSELGKHLRTGDVKRLPMFHDGVAVPKCTGRSGVASPATCVSARKIIRPKHCHKGQFTVEIDVLSTTNGRWRA